MHRNMKIFVLFFVPLLLDDGVFGDTVKTLSVMEGDSVTLQTVVTEIQKADLILWTFGSDNTRIAQINRSNNKISYYDVLDGRFKDRLKLDHQTGSLTITNTTTEHEGLYGLQIIGGKEVPPKKYNIIVYGFSAHLPVPVISRNCSSSSSSCSLVCSSVLNVSDATLSWYAGMSVLSSISASDLSISLSLPLEVEYQDKNTYSCVLNNPISNQTTHLDINTLCRHTCADTAAGLSVKAIAPVCVGVALVLVLAAVIRGIYCYRQHKTSKQEDLEGQPGTELVTLINGQVVEKDEIKTKLVMVGDPVTLHTDITEIQENQLIRWKFADSKRHNRAEFTIITEWDKTNNEEHFYNEERFKDHLQLDHNTGSLSITNVTPQLYGHYKLHIISEGQKISKTFNVVAYVPPIKRKCRSQRRQTCQ
ncbi:SLAM family member 5-like [Pimephales promelas]|uniref:SLAM family member 5-like n=1 Tax=Pimephales promelas TaxID=90988 RepID=UPI00195550CA|nr:SLAM family member 5-like [Pimephales promelas]XP_039538317.1 SLAM family member 5-like [Pimephales promelas]